MFQSKYGDSILVYNCLLSSDSPTPPPSLQKLMEGIGIPPNAFFPTLARKSLDKEVAEITNYGYFDFVIVVTEDVSENVLVLFLMQRSDNRQFEYGADDTIISRDEDKERIIIDSLENKIPTLNKKF